MSPRLEKTAKAKENDIVVLMGTPHYHGLNLVRCFGEQGIRPYGILVGEGDRQSTKASRYWERTFNASSEDEAIDILINRFGRSNRPVVVIPWSDSMVMALDQNLYRLGEPFKVPSISGITGEISKWMNKEKQQELAEKLGLRMSKGITISVPLTEGDLERIKETLRFPCIMKPVASTDGKKADIYKAADLGSLIKYADTLRDRSYHRILVQEFLDIDIEYDLMGYCSSGQYSYIALKKLRNWPNETGSTSYGVISDEMQNDKAFKEIVEKLDRFGYDGCFNIEVFYVYGSYYFNEINWRGSANVYAALRSGNNYPYSWYCCKMGKENNAGFSLRHPLFFMNEIRDAKHLKTRDVKIATWVRQMIFCNGYAYWNIRDIKPFGAKLLSSVVKKH